MKSKIVLKFSASTAVATTSGPVTVAPSMLARCAWWVSTVSPNSVDRPDSILFSASAPYVFYGNYEISSKIERKISDLPGIYRMPVDYSHDSGKHAVPAKHAIAFLDFLVALTIEHADHLYVSKNEFADLLKSLVENGHLTPIQASDYSERTPVVCDREDIIRDAKTNRDADLALKLVQLYKKGGDTSKQLYWLNQARHFDRSHPFFAAGKNITACLKDIESVNIGNLFLEGDSANWLLDVISTCPTIKRLYVDTFYPECINKTFVEFLTKSSSISKLDMSSNWSVDSDKRMTSKHALVLANALRLNKSIELLDLEDQRIGDEGLIAIVDALIDNPETKLKSLKLLRSGITDRSATYLLGNIDKIPSLRFVNLTGNPACSQSMKIDLALQTRETTNSSVSSVVERELDVTPNARISSDVVNVGIFSPPANQEENTTVTTDEDQPDCLVGNYYIWNRNE